MTMRPHGDTEAPAGGFDATLESIFSWAQENLREIGLGLLAFLVVAGIGAGIYEYRERSELAAIDRLAQIEERFAQAMGADLGAAVAPEPANTEQARKAREQALAELDALSSEAKESAAGRVAAVRAAEMEIDLGQVEAARARLAVALEGLGSNDPLRAVALRLDGYALEKLGDPLAAAESYEQAAQVKAYAARGLLWVAAAESFLAANAPGRAIRAYQEAVASSPELAEQLRILDRITGLEGAVGAATSAPVDSGR